jgi:hypothetical protein
MRENCVDLVLIIGSEKDLTHQERERFGELLVQMLGEQPAPPSGTAYGVGQRRRERGY